MSADLEVAVIGAGPHGISTTIHLRRAGVAAHLFGKPMSFWKGMPKGMKLRSNMSATTMVEPVGPLSLKNYLAEIGDEQAWPVPLDRFIEYGSWVQRRGVPDLDERSVNRLERAGNCFRLWLDDGDSVTSSRVVIAAGIERFKHVPGGFDQLPPETVSHTGDRSDLAAFAGRRVAVVGGGQSAFECAALMSESGAIDVELVSRNETIVWLRSRSPKTMIGCAGPDRICADRRGTALV